MKTCINCHACGRRNKRLHCEFYDEAISKNSVIKSDCQHYDPIEPDTEVDWSCFTKDSFAYCQGKILQKIEDDIYGCIKIMYGGEPYLVDVHHEYYDASQTGYDLEIYTAAKDYKSVADIDEHNEWLGSTKAIKTASSYELFQKRAVKEIIKFLNSPIE